MERPTFAERSLDERSEARGKRGYGTVRRVPETGEGDGGSASGGGNRTTWETTAGGAAVATTGVGTRRQFDPLLDKE